MTPSSAKIQHRNAQRILECTQPATLAIGGVDYPAARSRAALAQQVEIGGIVMNFDAVFRVRIELVAARPKVGSLITHREANRKYRIEKVTDDEMGVAWTLACNTDQITR